MFFSFLPSTPFFSMAGSNPVIKGNDIMKGIVLENRNGRCAVLTDNGTIEEIRGEHPVGATVMLSAVCAPQDAQVQPAPAGRHERIGRLRPVRILQFAAVAAAALLVVLTGTRADRAMRSAESEAPRLAQAEDSGQEVLPQTGSVRGEEGASAVTGEAESIAAQGTESAEAGHSSAVAGEMQQEKASGDTGRTMESVAAVAKAENAGRDTAAHGASMVTPASSTAKSKDKTAASSLAKGTNAGAAVSAVEETSGKTDTAPATGKESASGSKGGQNKKKTRTEAGDGNTGSSSEGGSTAPSNPPRQKEEPGTGSSEQPPAEPALADAGASTEPDPVIPEITPAAPGGNSGESGEESQEGATTPAESPETPPAPEPQPVTETEQTDHPEDTSNAGAGSGASTESTSDSAAAGPGAGSGNQ